MQFFVADAFTETAFCGNPAGVVLLSNDEEPSESFMQNFAAEVRFSETAFVKKTGGGAYSIRYFTPAGEVPLCGHATMAVFHILKETGAIKNGGYRAQTQAGGLNILVGSDGVLMDMAEPKDIRTFTEEEAEELYACFGGAEYSGGLPAEIVSTGLDDILLPVDSIDSLQPDFGEVRRISEKYGVVGVHAFERTENAGARCRNFAPLYDIDEEAATGTSNGALTWYLYKHGLIRQDEQNIFIQGEAMRRPSRIIGQLVLINGKPLIRIGGKCVTIISDGKPGSSSQTALRS